MSQTVTAASVMICDLRTIDTVTRLSDDTNREEFRGSIYVLYTIEWNTFL